MGLLLGLPSVALDVYLFHKEAAGQGEVRREVRLLQAMVRRVTAVRPPPRLHYPPHQLWTTMVRAVRELQEHPRPARRWPQASKGTVGQEQVAKVGRVAK